jgi:hypothetical protein
VDERGCDTFWMAEHHFQPEGTELIPNVLMMAMHLRGVTKNLSIGCGLNIVPMRHPLRLAEDYAMADILTVPFLFWRVIGNRLRPPGSSRASRKGWRQPASRLEKCGGCSSVLPLWGQYRSLCFLNRHGSLVRNV